MTAAARTKPTVVALTREVGKNGKLREAAAKALSDVSTVELPCVATTATPEQHMLSERLQTPYDWIVISSPESARVFLAAWRNGGQPKFGRLAAIGAGTTSVIEDAGLHVSFEPSKATFRVLASELPLERGSRLLYPASAKASTDNVRMLEERGFLVSRINTYSTETALWSADEKEVCGTVDVATFASPTTVKGWVQNADADRELPVACIGETSAAAAKAAGFSNVFFPERPGIDGWVDAIKEAADSR